MRFTDFCDDLLLTDLQRELAWAMVLVMRANPRILTKPIRKRRKIVGR